MQMTQFEYDRAMHQFLTDYDAEINDCKDYLITEFSEAWLNGMEIAAFSEKNTQYYAVIEKRLGENDGRIYELPESFDTSVFKFDSKE